MSAAARTETQAEVLEGPTSIRLKRTKAFLVTHAVLAIIGVAVALVETIFDLQPNARRLAFSWGVPGAIGLITLGAVYFYRRRSLSLLIPIVLTLDSLVVILQLYQEGDFETAWMGTPLMLLFMLPLFSDRPRFVWALGGFQAGLFLLLLYLRQSGAIPYDLRSTDPANDWDFALFSFNGFVVAVVGSALLAGRTSVDVLNSQRQLTDVLERQERELAIANARIVQQEKMVSIGQLTAGVAHEINNPLTFVQTNLGSLQRDLMDLLDLLELYEKVEPALRQADPDALERIRDLREELCLDDPRETLGELFDDTADGLARVHRIIRDLKVFTRLDEAERKEVDVREGIRSTLKILAKPLADRGVEVVDEMEDLPPVEVYAALLNQVFMNILQNALDAVPAENGRITVRARADAHQVVVEVIDNGPGVPAERRDKVFDPFFTTKEVGAGTGLGLSLSLDIIEKHGGLIEIDGAPGGSGALFRVVLPRQVAAIGGDQP